MNVHGEPLPEPTSVDQLIADYLERIDAGESIDPNQFMAEYPAESEALKRFFENSQLVQELSHSEEGSASESVAFRSTRRSEAIGLETEVGGRHSPDALSTAKEFGRYRIEKLLGQGAMGAVYLAHDSQLARLVALKIPRFHGKTDPELLSRFYREARAAAALRNPHICPVFDVGEIAGQHYLTMAYIEGRTLREVLSSQAGYDCRQVAELIRKLALALQDAHHQGVIHRDLKPANIMIDNRNEPVVMDFGLARCAAGDDTFATSSGAVLGTPAYMSPEQIDGDLAQIGPHTDVYCLGVIMYQMLTGEIMYQGSMLSVLKQIAVGNPRPPSQIRSGIEPPLEAICMKMIAHDRDERYASMLELANDLTAYLGDAPEVSTAPGGQSETLPEFAPVSLPAEDGANGLDASVESIAAPPVPAPISVRNASAVLQTRPARRNPIPLAIAAGLGGLLLLLAAVFYFQTPQGTLRVEINDPTVEVLVKGTDIVIRQKDQEEVVLSPGEKTLVVKRGEFHFETDSLTLKKGETTTVQVKLLDGQVVVQMKDLGRTIGAKPLPTNNTAGATQTPRTPADPSPRTLQFENTAESVSYAVVPDLKRSDAQSPMCIECYVSGVRAPGDQTVLIVGFEDAFALQLDGANRRWVAIVFSSDQQRAEAVAPLPADLNLRVHLAAVSHGGVVRLYINGRKAAETKLEQPPLQGDAGFHIARGLNGAVHEVRVSNTARYEKDFQPQARFAPDGETLALYHIDEGTGTLLRDSSGHDRHGKIVGAKWIEGKVSPSPTPTEEPLTHREAIEWVLAKNAHAIIAKGNQRIVIKQQDQIPEEPYEFRGFDCVLGPHEVKLDDDDCRKLAAIKGIDSLGFSNSHVTPVGVAYFKDCDIRQFRAGDSMSVDAIATVKRFKNLEYVDMPYLGADAWIEALRGKESITYISLYRSRTSAAGAAYLRFYPRLRVLDLADISDGKAIVAEVAQCTTLERLRIPEMPVAALKPLAALKNLKHLCMNTSQEPDPQTAALFPGCKVSSAGSWGVYINSIYFKPGPWPVSADRSMVEWVSSIGGGVVLVELPNGDRVDSKFRAIQPETPIKVVEIQFPRGKQITDQEVRTMCDFGLQHVESVQFDLQAKLTPAAWQMLLEAMPRLKRLHAPGGTESIDIIKQFKELEFLFIFSPGDAWAAVAAEIPTLRKLQTHRSGISTEGLTSLTKLLHLEDLQLGDEEVSAPELRVIASMTNLTRLRFRINPEEPESLMLLEPLTKLQNLRIQNAIAAETAAALHAKLPQCTILYEDIGEGGKWMELQPADASIHD